MTKYAQVNRKEFGGKIKYWHRAIAEKALGHELPPNAEVHHRYGRRNSEHQFIICENRSYHKLLESREAAYRATGDAHKKRCGYCSEYDDEQNMQFRHDLRVEGRQPAYFHKSCKAEAFKRWSDKRKASKETAR